MSFSRVFNHAFSTVIFFTESDTYTKEKEQKAIGPKMIFSLYLHTVTIKVTNSSAKIWEAVQDIPEDCS